MRVASFNLNNLFSRFDFLAEVDSLPPEAKPDKPPVKIVTELDPADPGHAKFRTFKGRLVKGKPAAERAKLASRIAAVDADVIAVQEAEDVTTLSAFAGTDLKGLGYKHIVLVEGNDERLIDVGILSRLPIGAVTSWRHAVFQPADDRPIFSRDLLQVEILSADRSKKLLTVFNTHLKSKFCDFKEDPVLCEKHNNMLRGQQAETAARIIAAQTRPGSRYLICGDFNDGPKSQPLAPLVANAELKLVNGLADAKEDKPAPADTPPAPNRPGSDRVKESGKPAEYELLDQIWLSPGTASKLTGAGIGRRSHLGGDGTDHDPVWVDLHL
jgi:endonuclease/exonuclease/phosphatase family metal-dependent hydrolase